MPIDYSRFDNIDVSDDEDEQAYKARKEAEEAGRRASKAQAKECVEAWWQACPKQSQFTVECAARLTRAGTTSLYNNTTGPLKGLGLGFERPLTKDDALETVQGLLKYVALERIGLPGLTGVPEGWDVFGRRRRASSWTTTRADVSTGLGPSSRRRCGRHASWAPLGGPRRATRPRGPQVAGTAQCAPRPLQAAGEAAAVV